MKYFHILIIGIFKFINHMPMLKKIHIVFRDLGNKEDNSIDLEYFYDFDLKDKNLEVLLIRGDDRTLTDEDFILK